jgi:hypothetical protein
LHVAFSAGYLDDKTALNTPDTLTHEDIGKPKVSSSYQSNIIIQSSDDPVRFVAVF